MNAQVQRNHRYKALIDLQALADTPELPRHVAGLLPARLAHTLTADTIARRRDAVRGHHAPRPSCWRRG